MAQLNDGMLRDRRAEGGTRGRFEREEAGVVSFADYRVEGGRIVIEHVETPAAARGGGAAGRLMAAIVARAQSEHRTLVPECGYAAAWMARRLSREAPEG